MILGKDSFNVSIKTCSVHHGFIFRNHYVRKITEDDIRSAFFHIQFSYLTSNLRRQIMKQRRHTEEKIYPINVFL